MSITPYKNKTKNYDMSIDFNDPIVKYDTTDKDRRTKMIKKSMEKNGKQCLAISYSSFELKYLFYSSSKHIRNKQYNHPSW